MTRKSLRGLIALGLLASFVSGCGTDETLSDRKRNSEREMATASGEETAPAAKEAAPGADVAVAGDVPEDDTAVAEPPATEEKPAKAAKTGKKSTKSDKPSKKGSERLTSREPAEPSDDATAAADAGADTEDNRLEQVRGEKRIRKEEAKYHAARGDEHYAKNEYEEAETEYRTALDLDPSMDDVRERLNTSMFMTGKRSGVVQNTGKIVSEERHVSGEQRVEEIKRNLTEGKAALADGEVDKAEKLVAQAVDMIALEKEYDKEGRTEANDLLRSIRLRKRELEDEARQRLLDETDRQARADLENQKQIQYNQVQELLRKSSEFLRQGDYEKAAEACERILKVEPENRVARFWLTDAKDQMLRERRRKLIDERLENVQLTKEQFLESNIAIQEAVQFPSDWLRIKKRSEDLSSLAIDDPEPVRRIKNALETRVDFNWDKTPLEDVVDQLRKVTGAQMSVDPQIDAKSQTVTGNFSSLPASNVLNLVLEQLGLTYVFKESILFITNPGQKVGNVEFRTYNVSDILNKIRDFKGPELILKSSKSEQGEAPISFTSEAPEEESQLDPEKLMEIVKASTGGEDKWGEPNSIEFHAGQFLVNAGRELHAEILKVLGNLRKDADLFVVIEARFIDVNDDFLEDIGIDSRALGLVNNYGTPFGNIINDGRTGGQDLGFVKQGSPVRDVTLIMGQDRWAGRVQHIIDGFTGAIRGDRLTAGNGIGGLTLQSTFLEPFQINTIIRAVQERADARQLTAPIVTAHNGQRVFVSVITQRAYIADYNLVSGGTGFAIIEVADPEVQTFQEGVILDVDPVISHDKRYITLDVRPTLATLIGGVISTILISLGSFTNVAFMVPIGVPEISLQQSFTSVTVPNGGTVLLGGFRSLNDSKFKSYLPILGEIPIVKNLFRRQSQIIEKRSLVILLSARIIDLRSQEAKEYNVE